MNVLFLGQAKCGKTCLVARSTEDSFAEEYVPTYECQYSYKTLQFQGTKVSMKMWDTAGMPMFQFHTKRFYKDAHVVVLCYSITDRASLEKLSQDLEDCKENCFRHETVLVGTKSDLKEQREVTKDDVDEFMRKNDEIKYHMETSALSGVGVNELFEKLVEIFGESFHMLFKPEESN